jgi:hypothetical protein
MARQKVLIYAKLLREAGINYEARDRRDLAENTFQLALNVALQGVISTRETSSADNIDDDTTEFLRDLLNRIPPQSLHAPTVEMLKQLQLK